MRFMMYAVSALMAWVVLIYLLLSRIMLPW